MKKKHTSVFIPPSTTNPSLCHYTTWAWDQTTSTTLRTRPSASHLSISDVYSKIDVPEASTADLPDQTIFPPHLELHLVPATARHQRRVSKHRMTRRTHNCSRLRSTAWPKELKFNIYNVCSNLLRSDSLYMSLKFRRTSLRHNSLCCSHRDQRLVVTTFEPLAESVQSRRLCILFLCSYSNRLKVINYCYETR